MSERSYLEEISIRNLGIIDSSSLELSKGLNVLTGETGAGKTMILTALSLYYLVQNQIALSFAMGVSDLSHLQLFRFPNL